MTHFIGAVVVPKDIKIGLSRSERKFLGDSIVDINPTPELEAYLNEALAPFDENMEYERWVPKAEVIAKERKSILDYQDSWMYKEFLEKGPEQYAIDHANHPDHVKYIRDEYPLKLTWDDEQVYQSAIRFEDEDSVRKSDGSVMDRYNPKSKWDWWTIGGRWEGQYADLQGAPVTVFIEEIKRRLTALSDPDEVQKAAEAKAHFDAQEAGRWTSASAEEKKARDDAWEALLKCPAFIPWSWPYNLVVSRQVPKVTEEEAEYDSNGEPVLVTEYEWVGKGDMGWWGAHNDEFKEEDWMNVLINELSLRDPQDTLIFIDFHI